MGNLLHKAKVPWTVKCISISQMLNVREMYIIGLMKYGNCLSVSP